MPPAARTQAVPFLPPAWAAMLKRSVLGAVGTTILIFCAAALTALLSYSPTDPSFNTATPSAPQNLLGAPGAVFADAALQTVGLAAGVLLLVIGAWGLRLVRGEVVGWLWLRTVGAIAATLLIAMGVEVIPNTTWFPVTAGFGGSAGQVLVDLCVRHGSLMAHLHLVGEILRLTVGGTAAVFGLGLLLWALTVRPVTLGASFRNFFVTTGAGTVGVGRRIGAFFRSFATTKPKAVRRERSEPRVDRSTAPEIVVPVVDEAEDFPDEDEDEGDDAPPPREALEMPKRSEPTVVMPKAKPAKPSRREMEARQGSLLSNATRGFDLPPLDLLAPPPPDSKTRQISKDALESNARMLESVLDDFGIKGQIVKVRPGPVVTLYELEPAPGFRP